MQKGHYVVALDGPAGCGKTSTASLLAKRLGLFHIDTGAMYRAVTLQALKQDIAVNDEEGITRIAKAASFEFIPYADGLRLHMNGKDVSDEIRSNKVTEKVSEYCALPALRKIMRKKQREFARQHSVVAEGRDIGTVVFPNAQYKFFLDAPLETRARRRQKELRQRGIKKSVAELKKEIKIRDDKDSSRDASPMKKAGDAILIDTTNLSLEEQVEKIAMIVEK